MLHFVRRKYIQRLILNALERTTTFEITRRDPKLKYKTPNSINLKLEKVCHVTSQSVPQISHRSCFSFVELGLLHGLYLEIEIVILSSYMRVLLNERLCSEPAKMHK